MANLSKHRRTAGAQRVFGYCRVSTDRQSDSGIGLADQRHRIEARCVENGWQLESVFVDAEGFAISHQSVANILARQEAMA